MTAIHEPANASPRLFFGPGVTVAELPDAQLAVGCAAWRFVLQEASPGLIDAARALAGAGATRDELSGRLLRHDGPAALARLYFHLDDWRRSGLLGARLAGAAGALATLDPLPLPDPAGPFEARAMAAGAAHRLSSFACLRRVGDELVIESAISGARLTLHDPRAGRLYAALASAHRRDALPLSACGLSRDEAQGLCDLMYSARMLVEQPSAEQPGASRDEPLAWWQFHDLLFHMRSRMGRHVDGYGGTFRFSDRFRPEPALKPPMSAAAVELYRPEIDRLCEIDAPFTRVLEGRRSRREPGAPLTEPSLGAFLYRAAGARALVPDRPEESSDRPYPSGGASYELELYLSIASCGQLSPGLYHYDPDGHLLYQLSAMTPEVRALLADAARALGHRDPPHVLITIAARLRRVFWKYESMAYALILQNVGALYQTMYLVATAMGLAPCALGGGNPDVFARASGLDRFTEPSVGEFALSG